MTSAAVQFAIDRILEAEGGIADVGDGKGITRFGQTPAWLEDNGFVPPSNAADAAENYAEWMKRTRLAEISDIDRTLGWLVADFAVHSNPGPAIAALQRALDVKDDGVLGPVTMAHLRVKSGQPLLARRFVAERMKFVGALLGSMKHDRRKFARGWLNRLADHVEALP